MYDDLIALQYLFREEQELSKMFKRLFEIQISETTARLIKDYFAKDLRYRSDLEYFEW
jgi:hypothetical protein